MNIPAEVEEKWQWLLSNPDSEELRLLIKEAASRPTLRELYPFMSLDRLRFSRTTLDPYTLDEPFVRPAEGGKYMVHLGSGEHVGIQDLKEAVDEVVARLIQPHRPAESRGARPEELPYGPGR
jgi:hypothetical protein